MGSRPTDYTTDLADTICARLGEGVPLPTILASDDMPSRYTVQKWIEGNEEFRQRYVVATRFGAEWLFGKLQSDLKAMVDVADGTGEPHDKRVRVDARDKAVAHMFKALAKMHPERFSDRQMVDAHVTAETVNVKWQDMSSLDTVKGISYILAKAAMKIVPEECHAFTDADPTNPANPAKLESFAALIGLKYHAGLIPTPPLTKTQLEHMAARQDKRDGYVELGMNGA